MTHGFDSLVRKYSALSRFRTSAVSAAPCIVSKLNLNHIQIFPPEIATNPQLFDKQSRMSKLAKYVYLC